MEKEEEKAVKKEKETLFFRFLSPLLVLCSAAASERRAEICFQPHSLRSLDAINRLRQFAPPLPSKQAILGAGNGDAFERGQTDSPNVKPIPSQLRPPIKA